MDLLKNLNNMITAKEFIVNNEVKQGFLLTNSTDELEDIIKSHIEFAKLHVTKALKQAENEVNGNLDYVYPLENIK